MILQFSESIFLLWMAATLQSGFRSDNRLIATSQEGSILAFFI